MTSKERVWAAIKFQTPDRIPLIHGVLPGAIDNYGQAINDVLNRYPSDFVGQSGCYAGSANNQHYQQGMHIDAWGSVWYNTGLGTEGQVREHPLADWADLATYKAPQPGAEDWPAIDEAIERGQREEKFIMFGAGRLFERMHFLRGYDRLLYDIAEEREELEELRDLILDHDLSVAELLAERDIDAISYMDDWGTQNALMIRPDLWRQLFKPAYKQFADIAHAAGKAFYFHSDGQISTIIPDLIEIGVDVLNPQFSCHELSTLAELCRGRVCLATDVDRQHLLPFGTTEQVRAYTQNLINALALPSGGLIGRVEVAPDTPPVNIEAAYATFYNHRWQ